MFKKFCLWASANTFLISIIGLVCLSSFVILLQPPHIKKWVEGSGAYDKLGGIVIKDAAKKQAKEGNVAGLDFSNELVQKAAASALTPQFYKSSSEQIIDGSYAWLEGKTESPEFSIDIASTKQKFVDSLSVLAKERYESLPNCASGQLITSTDIFKATCKTSVVDVDKAIAEHKKIIMTDPGFLAEDKITADSLTGADGKTFFQRRPIVSDTYKIVELFPVILGTLAALSGILVIVLCESKKFGVRKLGWRLIVAGIFGIITAAIELFGISKIKEIALSQRDGAAVNGYRDIVASGLDAVRQDFVTYAAALAGAALILGIIILLVTKNQSKKNRKKKQAEVAEEEPETKEEKEAIAKEGKKVDDQIDLKEEDSLMPEISIHDRPASPKKQASKAPSTPSAVKPSVPKTAPKLKRPNLIQ